MTSARMAEEIRRLLTGAHLGVGRDRLDWEGYTAVVERYRRATQAERTQLEDVLVSFVRQAQDSPEKADWELVADSIHLAYTLRIGEADEPVKDLDPGKAGDLRPAIERQRENLLRYFGAATGTQAS